MNGHQCRRCKNKFTTAQSLKYHTDNKVCYDKKNTCKHCGNKYSSTISMYRHMRESCKERKESDENEKKQILKTLEIKNKELEDILKTKEQELIILKNKELEIALRNKEYELFAIKNEMASINQVKINGVINNIVNGTVNNNTINNVTLIGYGKEDLSKIDKKDIMGNINGFMTPIQLTETIHFNPKYPEYHNVYIGNMKSPYAMQYNGIEWSMILKNELIDKLYDDKKAYIEENLEDFVKTLTKSKRAALERWLETEDDHEKIKEMKQRMKLLLYNKRNTCTKLLTHM